MSTKRDALLVRALTLPVRIYQNTLSRSTLTSCRFVPSCSTYAIQAFERCGPLRGLLLATWRLMRCHPFSIGGLDPIR